MNLTEDALTNRLLKEWQAGNWILLLPLLGLQVIMQNKMKLWDSVCSTMWQLLQDIS